MAKRKYSRKKVRKSKKYKKIKYSRKQKGGFLGKLFGNFTSIFSSIVNVSKKIDSVPIETPALSLMLSIMIILESSCFISLIRPSSDSLNVIFNDIYKSSRFNLKYLCCFRLNKNIRSPESYL